MGKRQERRQMKLDIIFGGITTNLDKAMKKVSRLSRKAVGPSAINLEKEAALRTKVITKIGSDSVKKQADDYVLSSDHMRGSTTGLRNEVGRVRNTFLLIAFALAGVIRNFKSFFDIALKTEAAMNSLKSVASNTGVAFDRLQAISVSLENRGIMSITGSSSALKNLSAAKAGITEVEGVMAALTDAAAFNRQGQLSWEEAVVGATEGIKNQNCEKWDTPIYDPVRGETKTIEEWHDIGILPSVLSLNRETGLMEVVQSQYLHYNGENEVYEIEFENGKKKYSTLNHPYLTPQGFKFVSDLARMNKPEVYYVNEGNIERYLTDLRNNIKGDLCQKNQLAVKDVQNLSLQMLLEELGVKSNSVKDVNLKKSMNSIDSTIKSLVNGLKLDVNSVEKLLSIFQKLSLKDMGIFAQIFAEIKITEYSILERIVAVFLVGLLSNVKNVEMNVNYLQGKLKEAVDSVLENVEEIGGQESTEERMLQTGEEDIQVKDEKVDKEESINFGNNKYISAIGYNAVNVMSLVQVIVTRIIYSLKPDTLNGNLNQIMVSPCVQNVIEKFTKEMTIHLMNSSVCSPVLLKVVKISFKEITRTYDLSIPKNFNFVSDYIIVSNSVMVDNAGVTKNVSIMYKDYASTLGKTAGTLNEAEKRQAIINGVILEAGIFAGDAERAMSTYQGQVSKFNVKLLKVQRTLGNLIAPGVIDMMNKLSAFLNEPGNFGAVAGISKTVVGLADDLVGIITQIADKMRSIVSSFGAVSGFIGGLLGEASSKVLGNITSVVSKMVIFSALAFKIRGYLISISSSIHTAAVSKIIEASEVGLLRTAAVQQLGITNSKRTSIDLASNELRINSLIGENEKTKKVFIQDNINARLRELSLIKDSNTAVLESKIIQTQARRLGFQVNNPYFKDPNKFSTNARIIIPGEKNIAGFSSKTNQDRLPFISPELVKQMGLFDRLKIASRQYFQITKLGFSQMKLGLIQVRENMRGVKASTVSTTVAMQNLKLGLVNVASAGKTMVLGLVSGFMRVFSTFLIIITIWQTIKGFIDGANEKAREFDKARKNLLIEEKSISGLNLVINRSIASFERLHKRGITLAVSDGRSLFEVNLALKTSQDKLNTSLEQYKDLLKNNASIDLIKKKEKELIKIRQESNKYLNLSRKSIEAYNSGLSETSSLFEKMAKSFSSGLSGLFKSTFDFDKANIENIGKFMNRLQINITKDVAKDLKLRKGNFDAYHAIIKINELKHQLDIQKIIKSSQNKIQIIEGKNNQERLKGKRKSFLLEMAQLKAQERDRLQQIQQQKAGIVAGISRSKLALDLFGSDFEFKKEQQLKNIEKFTKNLSIALKGLSKIEGPNIIQSTGKLIVNKLPMFQKVLRDNTLGRENIVKQLLKEVNITFKKDNKEFTVNVFDRIKELQNEKGNLIKDISKTKLFTDEDLRKGNSENVKAAINILKTQRTQLGKIRFEFQKVQNIINDKSKDPQLKKALNLQFKATTNEIDSFSSAVNAGKVAVLGLTNSNTRLIKVNDIVNTSTKSSNTILNLRRQILKALGASEKEIQLGTTRTAKEALRRVTNTTKANEDLLRVTRQLKNGNYSYSKSVNSLNDSLDKNNSATKLQIMNLKFSKKELDGFKKAGISAEEAILRIKKALAIINEDKSIIATKLQILSLARETNNLRIETQFFKEAQDSGFDPKGINNYLKIMSDLEKVFSRIKNAQDLGLKPDEINKIFEDFTAKLSQTTGNLENESKNLFNTLKDNIDIFNRDNKINIFDKIFGIDSSQINNINVNFNRAKKVIEDRIAGLRKSQDKIRLSINPQGSNNASKFIAIEEIDSQIRILGDNLLTETQQKALDIVNIYKEAYAGIVAGAFALGQNIGDFLFGDQNKIRADRDKLLREQDDAFARGELSSIQHGQNIAKINDFFAKKVRDSWTKVTKGVAQSVLEMTAQVIQSMAVAEASKTALTGSFLSDFMSGLGAAIPYIGAAVGVGLLASTLFSGKNDTQDKLDLNSGSQKNITSKFGGTITAKDVSVTISPQFIIEGNQIFIGSGSVVEFVDESTALMKESIQTAIDNREFNLDGVIQKVN